MDRWCRQFARDTINFGVHVSHLWSNRCSRNPVCLLVLSVLANPCPLTCVYEAQVVPWMHGSTGTTVYQGDWGIFTLIYSLDFIQFPRLRTGGKNAPIDRVGRKLSNDCALLSHVISRILKQTPCAVFMTWVLSPASFAQCHRKPAHWRNMACQ